MFGVYVYSEIIIMTIPEDTAARWRAHVALRAATVLTPTLSVWEIKIVSRKEWGVKSFFMNWTYSPPPLPPFCNAVS